MISNYEWKSELGPYIQDFIALKRANKFSYLVEEGILNKFDKLCYEHYKLDCINISRELISLWCTKKATEQGNYRNQRVALIRRFISYLNSLGFHAYIPEKVGSHEKVIVYVPTFKEMQVFFRYVDNYLPTSPAAVVKRLNFCYPFLFRLLFCCGLRISEACYAKRNKIDLKTGKMTILKSKGLKDREIYIAPDLCKELKRYDDAINSIEPNRIFFFPGSHFGKPINEKSVDYKFKKFWKEVYPDWSNRYPSPNCLRHLFVVRRITLWSKENKDLNVMMPYLSKYLGHSSPQETYYYYHHLESIYPIIQEKDKHSSLIIPEVTHYEK